LKPKKTFLPGDRLHDVDERLLAVDDVKEEDGEEEGVDAEAAEAQDEIDHVIAKLCVCQNLNTTSFNFFFLPRH
jgi:hypothetical protein